MTTFEHQYPALLRAISKASGPATLSAAIAEFRSRLERTDRQTLLVASRQNSVHDRAIDEVRFDAERPFLIGSYARHTQIRPLPDQVDLLDIDSFMVLKTTPENIRRYWDVSDSGAALLEDLRKALDGYQGFVARIDRPSVTLAWNDMKMELTPAFYREGGGYLIPGPFNGSGWIYTNPKADSEKLTEENNACNDELVPLVKMLKCWNRSWGRPLKSFEIETLATLTAPYQGYRGFEYELSYFFRRLLLWDGQDVPTASGAGKPITIRLSESTRKVVDLSQKLTEFASADAAQGNHSKAIEHMATVFGAPFPGAKI